MDRCALFVDAGYVLADGAMAVHGTRRRESVSWDYAGLVQLLAGVASEQSELPLLRCYWYESTVEGRRSAEHEALADLPGVKLRLAKMRPGRREGVESEIRRDLTTLARNRAVSDVMVVSADEDLAQVVAEVQDLGMRVSLLHVAIDGNGAIPPALRQECDAIAEIDSTQLGPYVELIPGAEPPRRDEEDGAPVAAFRQTANGHGPAAGTAPYPPAPQEAGNGYQPVAGPAPMVTADPPAAEVAEAAASTLAEAPASTPPGAPEPPDHSLSPAPQAATQDDAGAAHREPEPSQQEMPQSQQEAMPSRLREVPPPPPPPPPAHPYPQDARPYPQDARPPYPPPAPSAPPAAQPEAEPVQLAAQPAQEPAEEGVPPVRQAMTAAQEQEPAAAAQEPVVIAPEYYSAPPGLATVQPEQVQVQPQQEYAARPDWPSGPAFTPHPDGYGAPVAFPAPPAPPAPPAAPAAQPVPVRPSAPPAAARARAADLSGYDPGALRAQPPRDAMNGEPLPDRSGDGTQQAAGMPPSAQIHRLPTRGAGQHHATPPAISVPPAPSASSASFVSATAAAPPAGGPVGPLGPLGPAGPAYQGVQPGVSLPDAVQSAHEEGQAFGQSVAHDAPALWLEAVLARKPRMPSDLEASLLQGSALPIDYLLHDEVRHALRRGFWDALERARR